MRELPARPRIQRPPRIRDLGRPPLDLPEWLSHLGDLRLSIKLKDYPDKLTSREITAIYQPLDADRLYWYVNGRGSRDVSETDEEFWLRKAKEAKTGVYRFRLPPWPVEGDLWPPDSDGAKGGMLLPPAPTRERPGFLHPNFDPPQRPRGGYKSLYEAVALNGILSPVSLCEDLEAHGETGRPQVLGATHRLAAMLLERPDDQVPVKFFYDLFQAKQTLSDEY